MKKLLAAVFTVCLFVIAASAQKLPKPTLTPKEPTSAQMATINAAVKLHDAKKYSDAIALYDKVLAENPDAVIAIYEKALSLYSAGEREKAMEVASLGAKYNSDTLALFYTLMANALDDVGKPDEAIKIYREAESMLKGDPSMKASLASVYFNLGITYFRQKKYAEARTELKHAVENNFSYASPHYTLSVIFNGTKYKVPALLAAMRFVSLEFGSDRTGQAIGIINSIMKPQNTDPKTGNTTITLDMNAPKDEGDFGSYDLILGIMSTATDKDKNKTENERFASGVDSFISMIVADKKLAGTFVGKNYVPYVAEMQSKGHVDAFCYMVLYISGNQDARKWLEANDAKLGAFLKWAKDYQPK